MGGTTMIKDYQSKFDNYDISQRLDDLRSIIEIQCVKGNYDQGEYMLGMANGLLLAWNIMREPYGADITYLELPKDKK
jgi:hypothetical protein